MENIFKTALQKTLSGRFTQKELAKKVNISVSYLNDLIKGRKGGQETVRRDIASALGYDDYEAFLDVGRKALGQKPLRTFDSSRFQCRPEYLNFFTVPLYDHLSSIMLSDCRKIETEAVSNNVLVYDSSIGQVNSQNLLAFRMDNDDMEPLIAKGGLVLADLAQNYLTDLVEGGIYILRWDLDSPNCQYAVKRLKWAEKGHLLAVESENGAYESIYKRSEEIKLIGRVIWSWRNHS